MITPVSGSSRRALRRIPIYSALALSGCLVLSGCETNDPPVQRTVTGVVAVPAADQSQFTEAQSSIFARLLAAVFGESAQAQITGLSPLAGATVQLVRLNEAGGVVEVLGSDVTDGSGAYLFDPTPPPSSTLAVRVVGDSDTLRAIVTGPTVNISPASEAVTRTIIDDVITPSTGSIGISNFEVTEVASLASLVASMDVDVSGLTVADAVSAIRASASPLLTGLATSFSSPGAVTTLENTFFGGVDFVPVLIEPEGPGDDGGVELRTGSATWGFLTFNVVEGQAFGLRIRHDLDSVSSAANLLSDIAGTQHILTGDGKLVVGGAADNTVVGALTADSRFMVYPLAYTEEDGTVRGRGIRIATQRNSLVPLDNTVLDPDSEGTGYHLVRLRETLSGRFAGEGDNFIALAAETGTLQFDNSEPIAPGECGGSTNECARLRSVGPIVADQLSVDLDSASTSTGSPVTENIDGRYLVIRDGSTQMFRTDGNILGQGFTTQGGDILAMQTSSNQFQIALDVLANDIDLDLGDTLEITNVVPGSIAGSVTISASRDRILYTPPAEIEGPIVETFTYTISDGVTAASATATLNITAASAPPVVNDDAYSVAFESEDNVLDVLANDSDADLGDRLSIVEVLIDEENGLPAGSTVDIVDNRLHYTSAPGFAGPVVFQYVVEDSAGEQATATVTVVTRLEGENTTPVPADDEFTVAVNAEEAALNVLANDIDADLGDVLEITEVTQPANGTVSIAPAGDRVLYVPAADFAGADSFTYTVSDGTATAIATVAVTVSNLNNAPVANDDSGWNLVLPDDLSQWANNVVHREVGVAIRKGEDLRNSVLDGTYNLVQHAGYLTGGSSFAVGAGYDFGELEFNGSGASEGAILLGRRTSLDVEAVRAGAPAISEAPLPPAPAEVTGTYDVNGDGSMTLSISAGDLQISGTGAVGADGEVAAIAVRIEEAGVDVGRGLMFLIRQH